MKTAEEYLADKGVEDILFVTSDRENKYISDLISEFANAKAKALLEEAAEKIDNDIESPVDEWHDAFNAGMQGARKIVSSLIPKDTTKD